MACCFFDWHKSELFLFLHPRKGFIHALFSHHIVLLPCEPEWVCKPVSFDGNRVLKVGRCCLCWLYGSQHDESLQCCRRDPSCRATGKHGLLAWFQCTSLAQPHPNRQQCQHQAGVAFDAQACRFKVNSSFCHPVSCVPEGIPCIPVETYPDLDRFLFFRFPLFSCISHLTGWLYAHPNN